MSKGNKKGYMRHDTRRHEVTQKTTPAVNSEKERNRAAEQKAEQDIRQDADLSMHSPNDDLDEGELARLGEDKIY